MSSCVVASPFLQEQGIRRGARKRVCSAAPFKGRNVLKVIVEIEKGRHGSTGAHKDGLCCQTPHMPTCSPSTWGCVSV